MTSSTHIYGALIAGCAAGWCLRELWLRDAARREAEAMVRRSVEAAKPEALIAEAQVECFHDREFPVSSSDTALVLIDMQTDFLSKDGRLGKNYSDKRVKQLAATEAKVAALLAAARRAGMTIAHSRSHRYGADVRRDLCVPTIDPTYDFVDSCKPRPGEIVVDKWTFGAFASTDLETQLRRAGIKRILLGGILTNVCIMATAVQAVDRFFRVCLVEDACGAFDPAWHESAVELINGPQTLKENHHDSVGLYFGEVAKLSDVETALGKCGGGK